MIRFVRALSIFLFMSLTSCAQNKNNNMVIHLKDGREAKYNIEVIDSITFKEDVNNNESQTEINIQKVYGDGTKYCAFTSLVKRNGIYYLAFREGQTHASEGDNGVIKILNSSNGYEWNTLQTISCDDKDLRDPCLSIMPDGNMLLVCGARYRYDKDRFTTRTYISKEINSEFGELNEIILPDKMKSYWRCWLWRLTWNNGIGYGAAYCGDGDNNVVDFIKTEDGINFSYLTRIELPNVINECRVRFCDDGSAVALLRNETGNCRGYIGFSEPPYTDWEWKQINILLEGHEFINDVFKKRAIIH